MALFTKSNTGYVRDGEEVFLRSWWLAHKVARGVIAAYSPGAPSAAIPDERLRSKDQEVVIETIGYTMSFVLDRLRDDIERAHGWTDESYDLNIRYQCALASAFREVFHLDEESDVFNTLLDAYYTGKYEDGYDDYWNISDEIDEDDLEKNLKELLEEGLSEEDYNLERWYTYRLSRIVTLGDRDTIMEHARGKYRNIGMSHYNDAFFQVSIRRIETDLRQMANE